MEMLPMHSFLCDLMAHAEWANAIYFKAWGESPCRDLEEMRKRTGHIVGVQHGFLAVLRGEAPGSPPSGAPASFDEIKNRAVLTHDGLRALAGRLGPDDLRRNVTIPWFPDPPCVITVAEALVQVAMHSQHHRGQCMTRLKDFLGQPQNVDWIIWLWKQKPAAQWS
jgi:uncharacterized damage-inducible protein DinB